MASPTRYDLSYSFDDFQTANPETPLPADKLEIELSNIQTTTDEIIDNLNLIQRSDGALANASVTFDSLSNDVKTLLGSDITPRGAWVTATAYVQLDLVTQGGSTYLCSTSHTSGTFATDLTAAKWILWTASGSVTINNDNWSGTDLSVANGGTGASTLTGIVKGNGTSAFTAATEGTDYYKPAGVDVAVADGGTGASTAAGARTALGLGALAVLATVNNDVWSGVDLSVANGGTGSSTASDARSALDVYSTGEVDALITTFSGCSLYQTTGTTITQNTWSSLGFDTEEYDDDAWHDIVTNNSRITVDFTGRIDIKGIVDFNVGAGSAVYSIRLLKNGSVVLYGQDISATVGVGRFTLPIAADLPCTSGDYFELQGYTNLATRTSGAGITATKFSARRIK